LNTVSGRSGLTLTFNDDDNGLAFVAIWYTPSNNSAEAIIRVY